MAGGTENRHPDDETLERYSMQVLPESESAPLEEHLLGCESCRERLTESDAYVDAMRTAAARERQHAALQRNSHPRGWVYLAAAALCIATVAGVEWKLTREPVGVPVDVRLETMRGTAAAPVPAGVPLQFRIDVQGLEPHPVYRLEVVDSSGRRMWEGEARPGAHGASTLMPRHLAGGDYFVRLYSPTGELLREYGLRVAL